ncbi:T9SS type A sorting domain-containing protein [bacterium]|nr:T9SS type A sorting domain-containing protein [bacterium]
MNLKSTLLTVILASLILSIPGFATPINDEAIRIETIVDSPNRFTVTLDFQQPTLIEGEDMNNDPKLRVDLAGTIPDFNSEGPALPVITRLIAVPDGYSVNVKIRDIQDVRYEVENIISRDRLPERNLRRVDRQPAVEVGEPVWMRWLRVAPVRIRPAHYLADEHQVACAERMEIEFEFIPDGSSTGRNPDPERYWSQAFEDFFESMLLNNRNLTHILSGGKQVQRGSYIIITDQHHAPRAAQLGDWKRRKGFNVVIEPMALQGETSAQEIKAYIQDAYDNWDRPPEFVLLLGDENQGGIQLPTFYVRDPDSPNAPPDASDLDYSLLEGDDYFPDLFVGRISCNSPTPGGVSTALSRMVKHEMNIAEIAEENRDAFNRAVLWGCNYGQSGRRISTPVETLRWLEERLIDRHFDVFTSYFRQDGDNISSEPIIEAINRGVNIVGYRGWADASGTHYPNFYKPDLYELDNGPLLPIFTIIGCNTGDFANDNHIECFAEYALTRGDRSYPAAALGAYAPSYLHTKSGYNNPIFSGYYFSLLYRNTRVFGPLVLGSKMEIWRGFPQKQRAGDLVEFYFHIYNLLGDPEINVYLTPPEILNVDHPEALSVGDSYTLFTVCNEDDEPVHGAMVNLYKADETEISVLTDADGLALIPVQLDTVGELEITVIAHQAAPYMESIPVLLPDRNIGYNGVTISNDQGDERLLTGEPVNLTVSLRNTGSTDVNGISATLSSILESIEVIESQADFGDIVAGGTASGENAYRVVLAHTIPSADHVPFQLEITDSGDNSYIALFRLPIATGVVQYQSHEFEGGSANHGENSELIITVYNAGSMDLSGLTADLITYDNSVNITDGEAEFGDIAVGQTADCAGNSFRVAVAENAADGRQVTLIARFTDEDGDYVNTMPFNIVIGVVEEDDPVGPDAYGYYAYEDIDDDRYPEVPDFDWIELDPNYDGEDAVHHELGDDSTFVMDLPFSFVFYNREYNSIAICSNGWVSFEATTSYFNFRNWGMPSSLGPHTMIAPFWEDLVGESLGDDQRDVINVFTRYDENEARFVIEWSRVYARTSAEDYLQTFELVLYDPQVVETETGDGVFLFQYLDVEVVDRDETNFATVGIQDWLHLRGLEITFSNRYHPAADTLKPERAIKFTTTTPDPYLDSKQDAELQPRVFGLDNPYPNPFNSSVSIGFRLVNAGDVQLTLLDLNGRLVRLLLSGKAAAGQHNLTLNAGALPSGLYIIRLNSGGMTSQKKIILLQ